MFLRIFSITLQLLLGSTAYRRSVVNIIFYMKKKKNIIYLSVSILLLILRFVAGYVYDIYYRYDLYRDSEIADSEIAEENRLKEKFVLHPDSIEFINMTQDHQCLHMPRMVYLNENWEVDSVAEGSKYGPYRFHRALYNNELIYAMILANKKKIPNMDTLIYHTLMDERDCTALYKGLDSYEYRYDIDSSYVDYMYKPTMKISQFVKKFYNISKTDITYDE